MKAKVATQARDRAEEVGPQVLATPPADIKTPPLIMPIPESHWSDGLVYTPADGVDIPPLPGFMPHPQKPLVLSTPIPEFDPQIYARDGDHKYVMAPETLPAFPKAQAVDRKTPRQGGGGLRERWEDKKYIYEWDYQHGRVEKYNKRGYHLGEFDAQTGDQLKGPNKKRRIEP